MDKIQRFEAFLAGEAVDRVPAGFWFHFAPEYAGGEAMARAHLDYYRATDLDILKVMNDTGYRPIGTVMVNSPADWAALEPTPVSDPIFRSHIDGLKRIVDAVGGEVPIMDTIFNPYNQAVAMVSASDPARYPTSDDARDALLGWLRDDPEPVLQGLGVIAEDQANFYRACISEAGVQGFYFSAQGGEMGLMSDAEHAAFFKPFDLHVLIALAPVARFVVGHFCGRGINLARFRDYPVHVANWAHHADNTSLSEGKRLFGGLPILGGMDERGPLVYGPAEGIVAEIDAALDEMGTRGFMLGAGCTVPGDVPLENLIYARQVVGERTSSRG
jgi:uroporphyrinogen decarboxylase